MALHFPLLPLEALNCPSSPEAGPAGKPAAVVARGRIVAANGVAAAAGVGEGLRLSNALGLAPGLAAFERQPAREAAALEGLACWAGQFTPQVSPVPDATLLLEIGGCLRLFGGLARLHERVLGAAAEQGFTARSAVAPTALGATWLAWGRDRAVCQDLPALHRELAGLPCSVPAWDGTVQSRLTAFGLKTLEDVMALPRAELARRVGARPVADLARARGEVPDLRPWFVFPEKFAQSLELPAKVEAAPMLVFAGQRLLASLGGWLAARGAAVAGCVLELELDGGAKAEVALRPAEATRDGERLLRLLRERLANYQLPAPALALILKADDIVDLPGASVPLFAGERTEAENALTSLERLRARLGDAYVYTLTARPDYRPECATGRTEPRGDVPLPAVRPGARPLWLLPSPRPLPEQSGRPHWGGGLQLLAGPERLESGWWDEGEAAGDVRRDYFVAGNDEGQRLWIFRNAEGWFLHGVFA
jgi:protein ImuB